MRPSSSSSSTWPTARDLNLLFLSALAILPQSRAISFQATPSPNLDLSDLGRVLLAGNYDSVSLYEYTSQNEDGLSPNGSQSLYGRYPSGAFAELQSSDAYIQSMCSFMPADGSMSGIILGGNFTSVGSQQADAAALYDPVTDSVTPLPGLNGYLSTVWCDNAARTVYVGGSFSGGNSTNAIAWMSGWADLPFAGFNGPVSAITQLPNGNFVFGGAFSAVGNTTVKKSSHYQPQIINVGSANISTTGATSNSRHDSAAGIICKTPNRDSSTSFLLQDDSPGSITAEFGFEFNPSILRLLNTQVAGYGTKTFNFFASPSQSYLELSYVENGTTLFCSNQCPLAQNSSYQEFRFVRSIPTNAFTLNIVDNYGRAGGLGGIELEQDGIWAYAVDNFNSPNCDGISNSQASSRNVGDWTVAPAGDSDSQYLTTYLPQGTGPSPQASVIFMPDIVQSGNYSINMWTPGCLADNTCSTRGEVNITANLGSPTGTASAPFTTTLYQTNNYVKFDPIYYGYVEVGNGFKPSFTLTPVANQGRPLTVVAQSLGLNMTSAASDFKNKNSTTSEASNGGLNSLFEWNPNQATIDNNFTSSVINRAGMDLSESAQIFSLAMANGNLYAAGNFSTSSFQNVMVVENDKASDLGNGGLNDVVQSLYQTGALIYMGGNFTNTKDNSVSGLNNVVSYSIESRTWTPLGAGVNGPVYDIFPIAVNVSGTTEQAIVVSGWFNQINAFADNSAISVFNAAIWVPSGNNWLQNLDSQAISLDGRVNSYVTPSGMDPLYAGSIDSQMMNAGDVVGITTSNGLDLRSYPFGIQRGAAASSSSMSKRDVPQGEPDGVYTARFYNEGGLNLTIAGGHFTAMASNGSTLSNLAIINGTAKNQITGLSSSVSSNGTVKALESFGSTLCVGGSLDSGLVFYDLGLAELSSTQPAPLSGGGASVNAIALQPKTTNLFVGGSFTRAGTLGCPGLCIYDTSLHQWNPPAGFSSRNTVNILQWASDTQLILAGMMTIDGSMTPMAQYDSKKNRFTAVPNAATLPGAISAYTAVDNSYTTAFVAGTTSDNSSAYLSHYDGNNNWTSISGLGPQTSIEGLQALGLSSSHANTAVLPSDVVLLVMGMIELPSYGNVSAALFNGTDFMPFAFSTLADGSPGSMHGAFVENPGNLLNNHSNQLALGFVVLIGLACALGAVFAIVVIGILIERIRRKREGYVPAPTGAAMFEKSGNVGNISPDRLFGGVGAEGTGGPRI